MKSPTVMATALLVVVVAFLFNPVIFGGKTFGSPDSLSPKAVGMALNEVAEEIGEFPQWQPWVFSGMPSAEAFTHISKLYFPEHLFKLFFLPGMMIQMLHLIFAGIGCILLLRHLKCSPFAAALGAVGFMVTPYMTTMVVHGHGSQMMTAAYIPWIFWLTIRLWEKPNLWDTGWLAILMGFQLQRAHAQIAYYTWLLVGAYSLMVLVNGFIRKQKKGELYSGLGLFAVACIMGIGLSLLIYLPAMDYTPFSVRGGGASGGADYNYATGWSFHPKEILTFFIPSAFGFGGQPYWGFMPFTDYPNYMGIIILILAIIGLVSKRELIHYFLIITSALALLISFGRHFSLVYDLFFNLFPYFNKFRVPHMILILLQFNVAILAAFGLDAVGDLKEKVIPKWGWVLAGCTSLVLIGMVLGGSTLESFLRESFTPPRVQDPRMGQAINNLRWDLWQSDVWMMLFWMGSLLGMTWLWIQRKVNKKIMLSLVVGLAIIDISIVNQKIIQPSRQSGRSSQLMATRAVDRYFQEDEIIQFFKLDQSDYRIYPVGHLFGESRFAAFQIESIGGYHPAKLRAYNDFLSQTGNGASIPVLQMMNAKYLISPEPLNHPDLIATKTGRLKSSRGELDAHVYRVKDALPRVWFVKELKAVPENEVFKQTTLQAFNPSQTALVNQDMTQPSGEPAQITKMDRGIHHTTIHTESEGNQFLVLSEVFYPERWKATLDGNPIETIKVNGILRGVSVPAGQHKISFTYDQSTFSTGKTISFISFALALGLVVFGYIRQSHS
ncbi:MAG: YfhO family protein [Candidatus Marinimicrobia bacterium]|nr:YfhO family protein [Candidatus Neomarinimicrobiota bacterium]